MKTLGESPKKSSNVEFSKKRYDEALKAHKKFVETADTAVDFVFNKQWKDADKKALDDVKKPALTINRILPLVNTVYGEFSSMRSEIFYKATNGGSALMASKLSMLMSHILRSNGYPSRARSDCFLTGLITGRAFLEVSLGDTIDPLGGVEIRNYDARCVILPKGAKEYDPRTWPEVFTIERWSYAEIEEAFGKAKAEEVRSGGSTGTDSDGLSTKATFSHSFSLDDDTAEEAEEDGNDQYDVIVHEYRTFEAVWRFLDEQSGEMYEVAKTKMKAAEARELANSTGVVVTEAKRRTVKYRQFCNDVELLVGIHDSAEFSIIPFFPYFFAGITMGMVEPLISPQEQLNKLSSQELHIINTTANSGWQVEENSLVSPSPEELQSRGAETGLVIVRRRGTAALEKIQPNQIPSGIVHAADRAATNMMYISNVNEGALGHTGVNIAGKTVQEKKASMLASLQIIMDNFKFTESVMARVILANIQAHYIEPRVFRIVDGKDESVAAEVAINTVDDYGRFVDDATLGRYDVAVAFRPQQDVQNDSEFAELVEMRNAGIQIPDHQIVARSHVSNAEDIAREMRMLAGLEKTPEQQQQDSLVQEMQMMDMQLELEVKKQKVLESRAKTQEIIASTGLKEAQIHDLMVGQNERLAAQLQIKDISDQRGTMLRDTLSRRGADTAITTTLLRNSAQKEQVVLQNMLAQPTEGKKEEKDA